jgi:prevent-host-death family protein
MTTVMQTVSKAKLKAELLEYLRQLERTKTPIVVTHLGKPVAKIVPYAEDPDEVLKSLRGSVVFYKDPTEPVGEDDWEVLK